MGSMSIWHWLILLVIVLLLFGAGKVPKLMGDMAKGVKAFKEGLKEAEESSKPSETPPAAAQVPPPETKKDTAKV
jgi:sec-independent protein translocase protein TatA